MQKQSENMVLEHLNQMRKRRGVLMGGRICDRKKISEASEKIDKLQRKVSGLNSVAIIRKFRGAI